MNHAEARVRHTKHAPEGIVGASFRIIESLPSISESVNEMHSVNLEPYERQALASAALTLRYSEEAPIQPEQLLRARRAVDNSSDLWTSLNVVQENLLKGGQLRINSRRHTRRISSVGEDVRLNRALWTLAVELKRLRC